MSLRVWLPLRGSLENLGTDEVELTNNGATVSNQGKIGSCYNFGGSAYMVSTGTSLDIGIKSVCFWAYISNTGNYVLFTDYKSGLAFGVYSSYIPVSCSASNTTTYPKSLVELNQWNHFAIIKRDSAIELWINGEKQTKGSSSDRWSSGITDKLAIGARPNGNDKLNGRLNDFRMYDHALSEKEIHDISKALVLHYPLNERVSTLDNVYAYPTFNTTAAGGGWYHWGGSGHAGSYAQNTDKQFIYNKSNTYSHKVSNGSAATASYLCYQSPEFDGGYRSIQFIIKDSESRPITEAICFPDWNARDGGVPVHKWTSMQDLGDGFYLCKCEGIHQSGSNDLIGVYVTAGNTIYISEGYCENNREFCSELFGNDGTVYDCSGYHNDGEIVDATSITATSDTVRYDASTYFDGVNSCIKIPYDASVWQTGFTFNIWFKKDDLGSKNYETLIGGPGGFEMDTRANASTTLSLYMASTRGGNAFSPFNLGEWYMVTMVNDGTNELYYVNADLKKTITLKSMPTGQYYLGSWAGVNKQNYKGKMSDFRLYATALSAEDIKELYEVGASVDNLQNDHAYEYVEDSSDNPSLSKSGIVKTNSFVDYFNGHEMTLYDSNYYTEPDGSVWIRIFHHNSPASKLFASTNDFENRVYIDADRWLDVSICNFVSRWELMVKQKLESSSSETKWRWVQAVNPMVATFNETKAANVTKITTSGYSNNASAGGIIKTNSNTYFTINNGTSGNWYGAIGCWTAYGGGIPGYPNTTVKTGYVDLYLRIDNPGIYKHSISAKELIEI